MSIWKIYDPAWSAEWVWIGYATFLRATVILLIAVLVARFLGRAHPSLKAAFWTVALLSLLPLPMLRSLPFYWRADIVPRGIAEPMVAAGATMVNQNIGSAVAVPWTTVVGSLWLFGAALVLLSTARGWWSLFRLERTSTPLHESAWATIAEEARGELRLRRPVRLFTSSRVAVPLTWGTWRPGLLLPDGAADWPESHRRAVILHELAHAKRFDCFLAILARCSCALWWFHPGAWWVERRLRLERELACDQCVLNAGVSAIDYAECLMKVAEDAHRRRTASAGFPQLRLLRRSELRERLNAILTGRPSHGGGRTSIGLAVVGAMLLALLVGSFRLSPQPAVLWHALESSEWPRRAWAAEHMARFGSPSSLDALAARLASEPHPGVHVTAAFGARLRARDGEGMIRSRRSSR